MADGVIYVATGPDYLELAMQSAASLRKSNPGIPVDIFTDLPGAEETGLFDQVHPVARPHARAKLDCLPLSRFERTLFLDADTLVVGNLGDIWEIADRFDLAMAHDVWRASPLVRQGHAHRTPYAFPQLNSGVILYRLSPATRGFFDAWAKNYQKAGAPRDQITLKDMLWETDLRFYVLPPEFNMRRVTTLDASEPPDMQLKIVHSHRLMDHMRNPGSPRIRTLGQLISAERIALQEAWMEVKNPDHATWFTAAEQDK